MLVTQSAGKRVRMSHEWFALSSDWMKQWREFF